MTLLHILRVFADSSGHYGNPLGVFIEEEAIGVSQRQAIAAGLGFSETVFIEDAASGKLRLYTPGGELPFAGHPLVGTAWLLAEIGLRLGELNPPAGSTPVWVEDDLTWIRGRTDWCPSWEHLHAGSVEKVEAAIAAPHGHDHVQIWSFIDEARGVVRARTFAPRFGVAEDEACGSASMVLARNLGEPLTIRHGKGSEIFVRPRDDGEVELGGRVRALERRVLTPEDLDDLVRGGQQAASRG